MVEALGTEKEYNKVAHGKTEIPNAYFDIRLDEVRDLIQRFAEAGSQQHSTAERAAGTKPEQAAKP